MDLHAAVNGEEIGDDDNAATILKRGHQSLRKAFASYRGLMHDSAVERAAVAQDICMQLELQFAITRDIFYPAMAGGQTRLVSELGDAQDDIQECIETLRGIKSADSPELDSTMVRLMELGDVYFCKERTLIEAAAAGPDDLQTLGARMMERRKKIAGAVQDLESRS
ncbi:MAG: Hemerythrin cation binding protein [Betaproteobacteria bacterium]|nr:Hemerythrin cation binding protein [Betaproteobacteria bacterium]